MAKIILNDGTEEFLSPAAARAKVTAGEGRFPPDPHNGMGAGTTYKTRQLVAETPKAETPKAEKPKRKRRTKAQIAADEAKAEEVKVDED